MLPPPLGVQRSRLEWPVGLDTCERVRAADSRRGYALAAVATTLPLQHENQAVCEGQECYNSVHSVGGEHAHLELSSGYKEQST